MARFPPGASLVRCCPDRARGSGGMFSHSWAIPAANMAQFPHVVSLRRRRADRCLARVGRDRVYAVKLPSTATGLKMVQIQTFYLFLQ